MSDKPLSDLVKQGWEVVGYSVTDCLGDQMVRYLDLLIEDKAEQNEVLRPAICIRNGEILDKRIIDFQKR